MGKDLPQLLRLGRRPELAVHVEGLLLEVEIAEHLGELGPVGLRQGRQHREGVLLDLDGDRVGGGAEDVLGAVDDLGKRKEIKSAFVLD